MESFQTVRYEEVAGNNRAAISKPMDLCIPVGGGDFLNGVAGACAEPAEAEMQIVNACSFVNDAEAECIVTMQSNHGCRYDSGIRGIDVSMSVSAYEYYKSAESLFSVILTIVSILDVPLDVQSKDYNNSTSA